VTVRRIFQVCVCEGFLFEGHVRGGGGHEGLGREGGRGEGPARPGTGGNTTVTVRRIS
jgi:hypothetical protein